MCTRCCLEERIDKEQTDNQSLQAELYLVDEDRKDSCPYQEERIRAHSHKQTGQLSSVQGASLSVQRDAQSKNRTRVITIHILFYLLSVSCSLYTLQWDSVCSSRHEVCLVLTLVQTVNGSRATHLYQLWCFTSAQNATLWAKLSPSSTPRKLYQLPLGLFVKYCVVSESVNRPVLVFQGLDIWGPLQL